MAASDIYARDMRDAAPKSRVYIDDYILGSLIQKYGTGFYEYLKAAKDVGLLQNNSTALKTYFKDGKLPQGLPQAGADDPRVAVVHGGLTRPSQLDSRVDKVINLPGYEEQRYKRLDIKGKLFVDDFVLASLVRSTPNREALLLRLRAASNSGILRNFSPAFTKYLRTGNLEIEGFTAAAKDDPRVAAVRQGLANPGQINSIAANLARKGLPGYAGQQISQEDIDGKGKPPKLPEEVEGPDIDNAFEIVKDTLNYYGLSSLNAWAKQQLIEGATPDIIGIQIRQTDEFKERFPAIAELEKMQQKNRNANIRVPSPEEYIEFEDTITGVFANAGLMNLATADRVTELITNRVSAAEVSRRIQRGFIDLNSMPREVRDSFTDFFGPDGDLALVNYIMDTERTEADLLQDLSTAAISGAARLNQLGIGRNQAGRISQLGISFEQALQGFSRVERVTPLARETVGEAGGPDIRNRDLISAEFGLDNTVRRTIERRRSQRTADVSGSGGAMVGQDFIGLGRAT